MDVLPAFLREPRYALAAIVMAAIAARIAAALFVPDQNGVFPDIAMYRDAAEGLVTRGQAGTPYVMPLFPLLLAVTGSGAALLIINIALSVISVWLVCLIAIEIFADRRIGIVAGLGASLYPPLLYFAVVPLSETLFVTLLLATFLLWYRRSFAGSAVCAVLAILTRPVFDLAAPLLLLVFAFAVHREGIRSTARHLGFYALVYVALLAPWWLHNYRAYGQFVRLNPGSGVVLYAGNNPMNVSGGGNRGVDYDPTPFEHIANEADRSDVMAAEAVHYIRENPLHFARMAGVKFWRMWRPWPRHEAFQRRLTVALSGACFVALLSFALISPLFWSRAEARRAAPILLFIAYLTAVHMVLLGTIRYRFPSEPFLIVFAAAAFVRICDRWFPRLSPA